MSLPDPLVLLQRVRAALRGPLGAGRLRRADIDALAAYLARYLRLAPYVRHDPDCAAAHPRGRATPCTCGLARAHEGDACGER